MRFWRLRLERRRGGLGRGERGEGRGERGEGKWRGGFGGVDLRWDGMEL